MGLDRHNLATNGLKLWVFLFWLTPDDAKAEFDSRFSLLRMGQVDGNQSPLVDGQIEAGKQHKATGRNIGNIANS